MAPIFSAQQAARPIVLQYQSVVGPFTAVVPQAEPDRPGGTAGGSIAYRPTLTQYQSLAGPPGAFLAPVLILGWTTIWNQPQPGVKRIGGRVTLAAPIRVADVTTTAPLEAWRATYPDRLVRRDLTSTGHVAVTFSAAIPFQDPSRFGWRGVAPAWLRRVVVPPASQRFLALETPVQYPIPETSWNPIYPAWVRPARPITVRDVWVQNLDPLPNPPSPVLAWHGWQPSRLDRARRVVEFSAYTQPPKLTPFVPDLVGGLAVYPDWLTHRTVPPAAQRVWSDRFEIVIPDLRRDWAATYPDQLFRPLTRGGVAGGTFWDPAGNPGQLPTDWRKVGPDQLLSRRRQSMIDAGGSVPLPPSIDVFTGELLSWESGVVYFPARRLWLLDWTRVGNLAPDVPGGGTPCVELIHLATAGPDLLRPRAVGTDLVDLAATTTEGTDLDWC